MFDFSAFCAIRNKQFGVSLNVSDTIVGTDAHIGPSAVSRIRRKSAEIVHLILRGDVGIAPYGFVFLNYKYTMR